jgi:hypothetical protein
LPVYSDALIEDIQNDINVAQTALDDPEYVKFKIQLEESAPAATATAATTAAVESTAASNATEAAADVVGAGGDADATVEATETK